MMMMIMMMMTMIRNRDTVATTPLNNSSLPVLSKNISMGPPFTLPPSVFRSSPHTSDPFPCYSSSVDRPRSFASLRSFSSSRKTGKIGTFPRRKLSESLQVGVKRGEGKKGKSRRGEFEGGEQRSKGGREIAALSKETFFSFFFSSCLCFPGIHTAGSASPFPFLSPRVTRNAKGFSCFVPLVPPFQIKR